MKSIAVSFFISLVENIAVVLILPTLKNFALGVMLAVSTIFTIINPANAAANDMTHYPTSVAAHQVTTKESESINLSNEASDTHKSSHSKNSDQQKYHRSKYESVKKKVEMNRMLKTGEGRRLGSGSYSS
ncbi:hypothetical protein ACS8E3_12735 [Psychrobacter sp. 2Y5]|uniref:hypothetical protein n=1 Tax=unclassified Psychrobacter TaxID=196806 RepID=UPI003F478193